MSRPRVHPTLPTVGLWSGEQFAGVDQISIDLEPRMLTELESAACRLVADGVDPQTVQPGALPLGPLAPMIGGLRREIMHGRGFALLRGFPVDRLSDDETALMFWGIGMRLGTAVSQSVMGERLGHVIDVTDKDPNARAYRDRSELLPHTDLADILSFLCIRPARSGGVSRFVSSHTVYEEIRCSRPDLLEPLYNGFHYHRFGEQGDGQAAITPYRVPVYSVRDGLLSCRYVPQFIAMAEDEDPDIVLTGEDHEALDLFNSTAARADLCMDFTLGAGEAVVANNFTVLHARTAFEDHDDPAMKRHLLRLWLAADPPRPVVAETVQYVGGPGIPHQPGRTPSYATRITTH